MTGDALVFKGKCFEAFARAEAVRTDDGDRSCLWLPGGMLCNTLVLLAAMERADRNLSSGLGKGAGPAMEFLRCLTGERQIRSALERIGAGSGVGGWVRVVFATPGATDMVNAGGPGARKDGPDRGTGAQSIYAGAMDRAKRGHGAGAVENNGGSGLAGLREMPSCPAEDFGVACADCPRRVWAWWGADPEKLPAGVLFYQLVIEKGAMVALDRKNLR